MEVPMEVRKEVRMDAHIDERGPAYPYRSIEPGHHPVRDAPWHTRQPERTASAAVAMGTRTTSHRPITRGHGGPTGHPGTAAGQDGRQRLRNEQPTL